MNSVTTICHNLIILFTVLIFSSQALADCTDACESARNSCNQSSTQQQVARCDEQFSVCTLNCNRQKTMSCVYLGFKNHEGTADREKELDKITNGFARVTANSMNFDGLCRGNNMRCDFVLDWEKTMYSCGGEKREPDRVACCR